MAIDPRIPMMGQQFSLPKLHRDLQTARGIDIANQRSQQELTEARRSAQRRNRLMELFPEAMQGNAMARQQATAINPDLYRVFSQMDANQRAQAQARMQDAGKAALFVKQSENPAQAYQQVRGWLTEKYPEMAGGIPERYDPRFIEESIMEVQSFEQMMNDGAGGGFGLEAYEGVDSAGNPVFFQVGEQGQTRVIDSVRPAPEQPDPRADFGDTRDLRKEFTSQSEPFRKISNSYEKVLRSAQAGTAAGDMSLIFSFMKMLDPASVVREGEQASASQAAGVPDRVLNLYNRAVAGERLTPSQREDFVARARDYFQIYRNNQEQLVERYSRIAQDYGLDPTRIVTSLETPPEMREGQYPSPQTQADFNALPAGAIYRDPDDGQLYRKPGGQ